MGELARHGGIQVSFTNPATALWPISVSGVGLSLKAGIKKILDGFSYAIYPIANSTRVIVLAPSSDLIKTGVTTKASVTPLSIFDNPTTSAKYPAEALLDHALAALTSKNKRMHAEAIDQLVGIKDTRATLALIEQAANNSTGADATFRVMATKALWRHAADLGFNDEVSASALKHFTQDNDSKVAKVARQAVSSMEHYQQQQAH